MPPTISLGMVGGSGRYSRVEKNDSWEKGLVKRSSLEKRGGTRRREEGSKSLLCDPAADFWRSGRQIQ